MVGSGVLDAFRDLLLGGRCVGCGRPGRLLCATCHGELEVAPGPAWPTPVPPGLVQPWAATTYAGTVGSMVLGHKERRLLGLATPLGLLLARAIGALVEELVVEEQVAESRPTPVLLVPVPSRPRSTRERGYEPTSTLTRRATSALAECGIEARCVGLLRTRRGVADQGGLDAVSRTANLAGALRVHGPTLARLAEAARVGRLGPAYVVVCDDVLTTGATAAEAQRALRSVGLPPLGVAAVAATRLRRAPPGSR